MSEQPAPITPPAQTTPSYGNAAAGQSRYFFLRRRPKWRMARDYVRPPDADYQRSLLAEGFITRQLVEDSLNQPLSEELGIELRELDQHLLPHFWRLDQQAKYFQNQHYLYQWTFILAAFLTTALAGGSIFAYAKEWEGFSGMLQSALALGTAIVSGLAATVSFLDANQTPQRRWFKARAQAESLRSLYFLFIARQPPFDIASTGDRVQVLRGRVLDVLSQFQQREGSRPEPRPRPEEAPPEPEAERESDEEDNS